ncbi:MAG: hypothetical protein M3173_05555, partial [Chloroflexota bacterium]|nr:hypothetical protein [Chloroflexota bacterium]
MGIDPTRSVQEQDYDNALVVQARRIAERLAEFEPSPAIPYVTVTLDWRVEGTNPGRQPYYPEGTRPDDDKLRSQPDRPSEERQEDSARRRPARRVFEDQMDELVEAHGPHGDVYESLKADFERISNYLDHEIDSSAKGAYIVSCSAKGVFETVLFALPLPTAVSTGPTPALTELVRLDEDFPTYAALLADQKNAHLSVISHGTTDRAVILEGSGYPRKQAQGGWSQRRYQARADERIEAFARDVAEETRKVMDEEGIDSLVIAGDEVITSALDGEMHESVKERVIGSIHLNIDSSESELLEASMPVALKAERQRELEAVQRASDGIGADTFGAGGPQKVLDALQAGQVMTLVLNDDFEGVGWADYTFPAYGVGDLPTSHPFGGDVSNIVAIKLQDEFV